MPLGGSVHAGGAQGQALGLGGGQRTAELLGGMANLPNSRLQQMFANYIAQKDKRELGRLGGEERAEAEALRGIMGQGGLSQNYGPLSGQLGLEGAAHLANISTQQSPPMPFDAELEIFAQSIGKTGQTLNMQDMQAFDRAQVAATGQNPRYGQGFYGRGVTQAGLQNQQNLSLLGSAAGLFNPGFSYPDAQALGNTMTGAPVNYPGRPNVTETSFDTGALGGLESQSFNATDPGEWDFDLSNYITETAESGQEFDQQAAMAAWLDKSRIAREPSAIVDAPFVPQARVVSAGTLPRSDRIVGGVVNRGWDDSEFARLSGEERADAEALRNSYLGSAGGGEALIPRKKRAYTNAFQGVARPKKKRNIYQDSASMGWK